MSRFHRRHPLLILLSVLALSCGLIAISARYRLAATEVPQAELLWKIPLDASAVSFSPDGYTLTVLGASQCQKRDARTGAVLSSWTAPKENETRLTPDGKSLLWLKMEKNLPPRKIAVPNIEFRGTQRVQRSGTHTVDMRRVQFSLSSYDAATGNLDWKRMLPTGDSEGENVSYGFRHITNDQIYLKYADEGYFIKSKKKIALRLTRQNGDLGIFYYGDEGACWAFSFSQGPILFRDNGDLLFQKKTSYETSSDLKLEDGSTTRTFKVRSGTPVKQDWFPLVFNSQEQLLAGALNEPQDMYPNPRQSVQLTIWDVEGRLRWNAEQPYFQASVLAFSPDSCYLALGGADWTSSNFAPDGRLLVYDVSTGKIMRELVDRPNQNFLQRQWSDYNYIPNRGFAGHPLSIAWSPDSRTLATAYPHALKIWKIR
ncbi:hypothetical protein EON80_00490 [bacterium]|nr:MAG: hypothetical protein EON80_00490 [bacterium]